MNVSSVEDAGLQISPGELAELRQGHEELKLLDVREAEEQEVVRIEGALPVSQTLVDDMLASWPRNTPIVTYCHHGIRSLDAARFFIEKGFTNVKSLAGGIDAWAIQIDNTLPRY